MPDFLGFKTETSKISTKKKYHNTEEPSNMNNVQFIKAPV